MSINKKIETSIFTIYSQRLAGFLMQKGFALLDLAVNKDGYNVFLFRNSPELRSAIDLWKFIQAELNHRHNSNKDIYNKSK